MKISKRIFIALLIVSVLVTVCLFSAFAVENEELDFDYLLEYFEEPVLFDYDFSAEDVSYSLMMNDDDKTRITSTIVESSTAPGGKHLSIKTPQSNGFWEDVVAKNNVYFNWNAETSIDDFILEMVVSGQRGDGEEKQLPKIIISIADQTFTNPDKAAEIGTTLVALDFRSGCFSYLKGVTDTNGDVSGVYTNTEFAISEDVWYNVYVDYDSESGMAFVTVTNVSNPADTYTVSDAYVPYSEIANVRVGAHGIDGASARDSVMNFASLRAIGGKNDRDPADLQTVVEEGIHKMYVAFTTPDVSLSDKEYLAGVAAKLRVHGFTTEDSYVQEAYDELAAGTVPYCNTLLLKYADTYRRTFDYYDRRELINEALTYVHYLTSLDPADIPVDMEDEIANTVATIRGFDEALDRTAQCSLELIAAVGNNMTADYDDYDEVVYLCNKYSAYGEYADPTYEGASDAYVFYSTLKEAKADIETKGEKFIAAARILNDIDNDFNTRAQAYIVCTDNYFDNITYPGISQALTLYNFHKDDVSAKIEKSENFIKYVSKADYADYVPMKLDNLEEAKKYLSCLDSDPYTGVVEAKAVYDRVRVEVDEKVRNAELYIEAVARLDNLTGSELAAAIETALQLQVAGNVLGVDGIAEANIKLDKLVSSIELAPKLRDYFLDLVASIDSASTPEKLFEVLRLAKQPEADAHATIAADPSYESAIKAASAKLSAALTEYNNKVIAINSNFARANEVAANLCSIDKNANPISNRVIGLIKKFFDED